MRYYEPLVDLDNSGASKIKWSDLIPKAFGKVRVAWEDITIAMDGFVDIIMIDTDGNFVIGGWEYSVVGDEWDRSEPQDLLEAFEDGFIVTTADMAPQWASQIRKISPADKVNLALEEVIEYLASKKETDCD